MAQLYAPALGFLLVASYDSKRYGGGILPHLHKLFSSEWAPHNKQNSKCPKIIPVEEEDNLIVGPKW
jgi:hypothetical protein